MCYREELVTIYCKKTLIQCVNIELNLQAFFKLALVTKIFDKAEHEEFKRVQEKVENFAAFGVNADLIQIELCCRTISE